MKPKQIRTKPVPQCPECLQDMVLRKPKSGDKWNPFWSCKDWPECNGHLEIDDEGNPEEIGA